MSDRDGGGRRNVGRPNWAMDASPGRPGAILQKCREEDSRILTRQSQVDGSSVPASVRRPNCKQDARDMYIPQSFRAGRRLPPLPRPVHEGRYHGRPVPIHPSRLNFPCTFGRRLPPIPETGRPRGSRYTPRQMPTIPEAGRFRFPGRPLPPPSLYADMHMEGRPLVPVPNRTGYSLWHNTLSDVTTNTSGKIDIPYEDRKTDALNRARKIKEIKSKRDQELITMNKSTALRKVKKIKKKKETLTRQRNVPKRTYASIYDVINEKICGMFATTLNDIKRDIIQVIRILQYQVRERGLYRNELQSQKNILPTQKTRVVLNINIDNGNLNSIERLIRFANNPDHTHYHEDWRKVMEIQKYRADIIKLTKLKMRRLKKLCICGGVCYTDDLQCMVNLIMNLIGNYKSFKVLRDIFKQQCIDSFHESHMQIEKQDLGAKPQEFDTDALARIQGIVKRTAEDIRIMENEHEMKEQEIYETKKRNIRLEKIKRKHTTKDKTIGVNKYTTHTLSLKMKRLNKIKRQQRLQSQRDILFMQHIGNVGLINSLYRSTCNNLTRLSEAQRRRMRRMRRMSLSAAINLHIVKNIVTSPKKGSIHAQPIDLIYDSFRQMKEQTCSSETNISNGVKRNVQNVEKKIPRKARKAENKVPEPYSGSGRKLSKGMVHKEKTDTASNKGQSHFTRFVKPKSIIQVIGFIYFICIHLLLLAPAKDTSESLLKRAFDACRANKEQTSLMYWEFTKTELNMTMGQYLDGIKNSSITLLDENLKHESDKLKLYFEERNFEMKKESIKGELYGFIQKRTFDGIEVVILLGQRFLSILDFISQCMVYLLSQDLLRSGDSLIHEQFNASNMKITDSTVQVKREVYVITYPT